MPKVLATEEEIHRIEKNIVETGFYDPELWRSRYFKQLYSIDEIEFDVVEQAMIREMVAITGKDSKEIIRKGVRYLYDEIKLWHKKGTEYYKPASVE